MKGINFESSRFQGIFALYFTQTIIYIMRKIAFITSLFFASALLFSACQSASESEDAAQDEAEMEQSDEANQQQQQTMQQPQQGAQMELSDDDIKEFAAIDAELRVVQEGAREDMMASIEDNGLSLELYQQYSQLQQQGSTDQLTESDLEAMANINEKMMEIQTTMQTKMEEVITAQGMTMDKYQQMAMTINQNPEYQQKMMELMDEDM